MTPRQVGNYRLDSLLGAGGMGEVHRAYDTRRGRNVALKLLPAGFSGDREYRERFQRETQVAARLMEPHVIPIYDSGEIDGQLFTDMRLVDGNDLAVLIAANGRIEPERAVHLVSQVAQALDAAHADGLVHRDIKPSNILVTSNDFVYVVDFGVARSFGGRQTALTITGQSTGTLHYMAPERFAGHDVDGRADVYSLACVLHECLTGVPPFTGRDLPAVMYAQLYSSPPPASSLADGVPPALDAVIARGMAKDPNDRYPTAGALAAAVGETLLTEAPAPAPVTEPRIPAWAETPVPPRWQPAPAVTARGDGAEPAVQVMEPLVRATQPVQVAEPPAPATQPVRVAQPLVQEAEPVHEAETQVQEAEPVHEAETQVQVAEPLVQEAEPLVQEAEPLVQEAEPVHEAEPVQEAEPPAPATQPVRVAEPLVQEAEPLVQEAEPLVQATQLVHEAPPAPATQPVPVAEPSVWEPGPPARRAEPPVYEAEPAGNRYAGRAPDRPTQTVFANGDGDWGRSDWGRIQQPAYMPQVASPDPYGSHLPPGETPGEAPGRPARGGSWRRLGLLLGAAAALAVPIVIVIYLVTHAQPGTSALGATGTSSATTNVGPTGTAGATSTAGGVPAAVLPTVGAKLAVGKNPSYLEVSPNGRFAYVANPGAGVITVLNTVTDRVSGTVKIPQGPPQFVSFSPDSRTAYVSVYSPGNSAVHLIAFVDTATGQVTSTVPVDNFTPGPSTTGPGGRFLYVPNHNTALSGTGENFVDVIDTATAKLVGHIAVPADPHWVVFSKNGRLLYTSDHMSATVTVVNATTNSIVANIPVGETPHSEDLAPNGRRLAVTSFEGNVVFVINTVTDRMIAQVPVGRNPVDITYSPDGRYLFTVNNEDNSVTVIDTANYRVIGTIPTGKAPTSISILPNGRQAYVTDENDGTVEILNLGH